MPRNSAVKVATREEFSTHLPTLCNSVIENNFEPHTASNPYLNPVFGLIDCMVDKDTMRALANDRLLKLRTEEKSNSTDVRRYMRGADQIEKNFILSLDVRVRENENSDAGN